MGSATDIDGSYTINRIPIGNYILVSFYIGYEEFRQAFKATPDANLTINIPLSPSAIQLQETKVTGTRRQQKVTDAPASMEIVSQRDIKRQSTTNLGSYLKGLKGVDFTSSGINNYSISIRGFNSSFSSRLLTLTDGRVANIPALRVVNYSTIPQSTDDIEKMEVVIGPATALYGANAHSGVVNIISKSPATSEGITISASGTADERELRKLNARWAKKLTDKVSMKVSGSLLHAYEWNYVSEEEYKNHSYPWSGNLARKEDGYDNNPWILPITGTDYTSLINYVDRDGNRCTEMDSQNCKLIGDGERNNTGDPDDDGWMGEDWVNGYDDDGDGFIDEDAFSADGIDNNNDGEIDENIDFIHDKWIDGYDNNQNGEIDEGTERDNSQQDDPYPSHWAYDLEEQNIIIRNGKKSEYINGELNPYYLEDCILIECHVYGDMIYDEDNVTLLFDNYEFDYGIDGLPGDLWVDLKGDGQFQVGEGLTNGTFATNEYISNDVGLDGIGPGDLNYPGPDEGEGDGIWQPGDGWVDVNGNGIVDTPSNGEGDTYVQNFNENYYEDVWPPKNGVYDTGEPIYDYGQDGLPNTGDPGEGDGKIHILDENEADGLVDTGDGVYGGESDYKDNFQRVNDINGDGLSDYPDFEVDNRKIEIRIDYDFDEDLNFTFQSGFSTTKTQQVTGTSRYLADGYEYTFYQLRSRYKNWFAQVYLNQANSGNTRSYNQGNVIDDESRNIAAQLQNNLDFYTTRTKLVWGLDYFRTEPKTFGTILNDGPNGYDNNGNLLLWKEDKIDNDGDGQVDDINCPEGYGDNGKTGIVNGAEWQCDEGVDEPGEFTSVISNELGIYYQSKTNIWDNDVLQLITSARFDYHDLLDEGMQFGPKLGLIFKPSEKSTFRFTYGKAFNTPNAIALNTELFIRKLSVFDVYLRGNKDGTPYARVDTQFDPYCNCEVPYKAQEPGFYSPDPSLGFQSMTPNDVDSYYFTGGIDLNGVNQEPYTDRVSGAPYFFNWGDMSEGGVYADMMPLDTLRYLVYVPDLTDGGVLYDANQSYSIADVQPLKTEKIQTFEFGYKGFFFNRLIMSVDYYVSQYEDFFSPPTVITPLIALRELDEMNNDITDIDNLTIVGMIPSSIDLMRPPFGTMWDGIDNDNDWPEYATQFGWTGDCTDYSNPTCGDGNPIDHGEWGIVCTNPEICQKSFYFPHEVILISNGKPSVKTEYSDENLYWEFVGVDEWSDKSYLSEAELVPTGIPDPENPGEYYLGPGFASQPPQIILSPLNYGNVKMQGIDYDITFLLPEYKLFLSANLSWYGTTKFFNELTRKNDPINAPEYKWNLSAKFDTDLGNFTFSYRHIDKFEWKDGIWAGVIGPYNLFDIHYNYKLFESLRFNVSAMNIANNVHKELVGGAKMGRQVVMRVTSEF
jgi:outer membrane receptor for ferrienterochelin and colicin